MEFENDKERQQAHSEGWTLRNGQVCRFFTPHGMCQHVDMLALFEFLALKGRTSEFHKRVFLNIEWTGLHSTMMRKRGIGYSLTQYVLIDPQDRIDVTNLAAEGDPLAIKIITTIAARKLMQG